MSTLEDVASRSLHAAARLIQSYNFCLSLPTARTVQTTASRRRKSGVTTYLDIIIENRGNHRAQISFPDPGA